MAETPCGGRGRRQHIAFSRGSAYRCRMPTSRDALVLEVPDSLGRPQRGCAQESGRGPRAGGRGALRRGLEMLREEVGFEDLPIAYNA